MSHGVAFVVVLDGIAEVDGIGGVGTKGVIEIHLYALAVGTHVGRFYLWRGYDHLLTGFLQLDILVKEYLHLPLAHVHSTIGGTAAHHTWGRLVESTAIGIAYAGAGCREKQSQEAEQKVLPLHQSSFILSISSIVSRLLLKRGTLCCPPSLPFDLSQSWNTPGRAFTICRGCRVISL